MPLPFFRKTRGTARTGPRPPRRRVFYPEVELLEKRELLTRAAVTAVSPNFGPTAGGSLVSVTGSNFLGASRVLFGGPPASSYQVVSATQINVTAPFRA